MLELPASRRAAGALRRPRIPLATQEWARALQDQRARTRSGCGLIAAGRLIAPHAKKGADKYEYR
jgi:hypothetical protein